MANQSVARNRDGGWTVLPRPVRRAAGVMLAISVVLLFAAQHGWPKSGAAGAANPARTEVSGAAAARAYDFYSKFGVNGNLDSGGSVAAELADINYLGIRNLRSSAYNASPSDADKWFKALGLLSAQGIRQHIELQAARDRPFNRLSDWIAGLRRYVVAPYGTGLVAGVSGPNETDIGQYFAYQGLTGVAAANAAQAALYRAIKSDPALRSIAVDMWPLGSAYRAATTGIVGDQTAHCDRANLHDYYAADNTHQPTGDRGGMPVALQRYLTNARRVCDRTAFVTTETGWYTPWQRGDNGSGTNEYEQARLILNDLFDHASLPYCQGVYVFTLRWGSMPPDPSRPGWGVINDDGSPKAAGVALHNLMAILTDAGSDAKTFTPGRLQYSLSGMPAASGHYLVQRSNGAFLLILWNETPIWDVPTGRGVNVPHSTVTISLPAGSSGRVYDPTKGSVPVSRFGDFGQLQVSLDDSPLVIEIH